MGKQLCYAAILAILVAVAGPAWGQDGDPNLMGWWKFDGDTLDSSGNEHHGTLMGNAMLVAEGYWGGALSLDGSDAYVTIPGYKGINADRSDPDNPSQRPFTVTCWILWRGDGSLVCWGSSDGTGVGGQYQNFRVHGGRLRAEHGNGRFRGATLINDGEWHHVAMSVAEGSNLEPPGTQLYVDGVKDTQGDDTVNSQNIWNLTEDADVGIGTRASHGADRLFNGMFDDVRIYDKALTQSEVRIVAGMFSPYQPDPADGALIEATSALLQWTSGPTAVESDLYFGTNPAPGPDELIGRQSDTQYMALDLEQEKTYYWRVDAVEADGTTIHTGDVWSFWVPPRRAYDPQPLDGLINVFTDAQLSWTPGWSPLMHAVYFGTDPDKVASDTGAFPQMDATYDPGPLELETTYYWRVDEFYAGQWVASPVWSFATLPPVPPAEDPNLVVYWTLDETGGRTAIDMSGHGHHGTYAGNPERVDGLAGSALHFLGNFATVPEYVEHLLPADTIWPTFTVALWVKADSVGQVQYCSAFSSYSPASGGFQIDVDGGDPGVYRSNPQSGSGNRQVFGPCTTDWVHLALTCDSGAVGYYYDGSLTASGTFTDADMTFNKFGIAANRNRDNRLACIIDDFRVYDKVLSADEVKQLTRIDPSQAWDPTPANTATLDILTMEFLSWQPGDGAAEHDVYLGDDKAVVATADASDATGVYRGRQAETTYVPPEDLSLGATYFWRIDEVDADGNVTAGRVWSFTLANGIIVETAEMTLAYDNTVEPYVTEIALDIAQDWSHPDLVDLSLEFQGAPPVFVEDADGVITMSGAGGDIWGTSDEFRYACKTLNGDATMVARVLSNGTGSNAWAKGGVMIRQSLDAGSTHAFMPITGGDGNGYSFQRRPVADAASTSDNGVAPAVAPPYWVKIQRTGDDFSAYISPDGEAWAEVGTPQTIAMTDPVLIGLAVTSHASGELRAYQFDSVSTTGDVTGDDWQVVDIGVEQGGNDPAALYVAVEDAAGGSAVVVHPDPAATNIAEWTEWRIPLADLTAAGVDLATVVKVAVGAGDGEPDGTGTVLIRNIQVVPPVPPVITVAPAESVETTGDDGMVLSINGIAVEDLVLGTTSTDFEKWADHPAPHADDFDLGTYASLDDCSYITMMFDVPVSAVFVIERGANDLGFLQPLDAAGDPVGGLQTFAKSDWFKPGIQINSQDAGAIVITAEVPISGIMVLPPEDANMGLDPASVSAIPAE